MNFARSWKKYCAQKLGKVPVIEIYYLGPIMICTDSIKGKVHRFIERVVCSQKSCRVATAAIAEPWSHFVNNHIHVWISSLQLRANKRIDCEKLNVSPRIRLKEVHSSYQLRAFATFLVEVTWYAQFMPHAPAPTIATSAFTTLVAADDILRAENRNIVKAPVLQRFNLFR